VIGQLTGVLRERSADGSCILDVRGVGYELFVPLRAATGLPDAGELTLFVHTHVREDAITLYGFSTRDDRAAFRALLGVASVGPKVALAILHVLDAAQLADMVALGDKAGFKGIPGVGKKTVERLLLDLKDRLPRAMGGTAAMIARGQVSPATPPPASGPLATVTSALVQMGYKAAEAERAVESVAAQADGKPVEELLREALRALG